MLKKNLDEGRMIDGPKLEESKRYDGQEGRKKEGLSFRFGAELRY